MRRAGLLAWAVAALIFALHADAFRGWLVDDAGISLAFAKNLADGHGLVPQPGGERVEGFSNPLWVLLLALCWWLGGVSVPATLKLLGLLCGVGAVGVVVALAGSVARRPALVGGLAAVFCALNTSVVLWCVSGLENGLTLLLSLLLARSTVGLLQASSLRLAGDLRVAAALSLALWLTRPDAVLFAALPAAVVLIFRRPEAGALRSYLSLLGAGLAGVTALRWWYFGALVPNTYVAKGGVRLSALAQPELLSRIDELAGSLFFLVWGAWVLAAVAAATLWLGRAGRLGRPLGVVASFAAAGLLGFCLLPRDWMGELRFATPFFPFFYLLFFSLVERLCDAGPPRLREDGVVAVAALCLALSLPGFCARTRLRATVPTVSVAFVQRAFAERFDRWAAELGVASPSALLPDVGGVLLGARTRAVDLAGLCDATVARTLRGDKKALHEHIFRHKKPTFLHVQARWSALAALDEDPRFTAEYEAIHLYRPEDSPLTEGHAAGLFVRKDAVAAWPERLASMRAERHDLASFTDGPAASPTLRALLWLPLPGAFLAGERPR